MAWKALVPPRKGTQDATGMCLRFAQSFFGAPVRYASAWEAWQHVQAKYSPGDPLPNVPVLLWFEHWGTYGAPPTYGNWGHVAAYVPGDAIYTSPAWGYGQGRYGTISEIEAAFNCRYVGWSPDINGLFVADYTPEKTSSKPELIIPEEEIMNLYFEATNNSSPAASNGSVARIWAGERKLNGVTFSSVWERSPDGAVRRLYKQEWDAIKAAYAAAGRKIPLAKVGGNMIEQLIYGKRV